MSRRSVLGVACPFLLALFAVGNTPTAASAKAPLKSRELMALLDETLDTKDFQAPMTLKEALGLIQDKLNERYKQEDVLPILVNDEAFKEENSETPDIYDTQVKFPPFPRKMTVAMALRLALSKVPTNNATFLLRQGVVEVTTLKAASPKQLLRQRVTANYKQYPLHDAVDALSELTGLSVVVDARAGDKIKTPVTARFSNDATLEGALRLLTEMADLKLFITNDAVFVTTPANARVLHKARRDAMEEAHRDRQRGLTPPEENPPPARQREAVGACGTHGGSLPVGNRSCLPR